MSEEVIQIQQVVDSSNGGGGGKAIINICGKKKQLLPSLTQWKKNIVKVHLLTVVLNHKAGIQLDAKDHFDNMKKKKIKLKLRYTSTAVLYINTKEIEDRKMLIKYLLNDS